MNAFINHVLINVESWKPLPLLWLCFQVVWGLIMVVVNQINLDPCAIIKAFKM